MKALITELRTLLEATCPAGRRWDPKTKRCGTVKKFAPAKQGFNTLRRRK